MKIFFIDHWADMIIVIVFAVLLTALYLNGKKKIASQILYFFITEAERIYGDGAGKIKLAYVMERVYASLPSAVKTFLTYDKLKVLIEKALEKAKKIWEEEAEWSSYIESAG